MCILCGCLSSIGALQLGNKRSSGAHLSPMTMNSHERTCKYLGSVCINLSYSMICSTLVPIIIDIMIKPDGVQRRLVGNIIGRFESKGFQLRALKLVTPTQELLEEHYRDLKSKPFFPKLMSFMLSGPVVSMVSGVCKRDTFSCVV